MPLGSRPTSHQRNFGSFHKVKVPFQRRHLQSFSITFPSIILVLQMSKIETFFLILRFRSGFIYCNVHLLSFPMSCSNESPHDMTSEAEMLLKNEKKDVNRWRFLGGLVERSVFQGAYQISSSRLPSGCSPSCVPLLGFTVKLK